MCWRGSFCSHTATACLQTLKSNATWYESVVLICCQLWPRRIWQYLVWLRSANMGLLIIALACVRGSVLAISRLTRARNFGRRFVNIASRRASKDIARSSSFVCFASALPHAPSALSSVTLIDLKACRVIGMLQPFSSEIQTQLSTMPCLKKKKRHYSLWTYACNCFFVHFPSPTKPCFLRENAMSKKSSILTWRRRRKAGDTFHCRQKMSVTQKVWELKGESFSLTKPVLWSLLCCWVVASIPLLCHCTSFWLFWRVFDLQFCPRRHFEPEFIQHC